MFRHQNKETKYKTANKMRYEGTRNLNERKMKSKHCQLPNTNWAGKTIKKSFIFTCMFIPSSEYIYIYIYRWWFEFGFCFWRNCFLVISFICVFFTTSRLPKHTIEHLAFGVQLNISIILIAATKMDGYQSVATVILNKKETKDKLLARDLIR